MRIITHSIRARVLVLVVSVSILPLIVVASLLIVRMYQNDRATSQLVQDATNAQASIYVTTFVDQADRELRRIVQIPTLLTTTMENQETLLAQALFSTPLFAAIRLVDIQGREQVHSSRLGIGGLSRSVQNQISQAYEFCEAEAFERPHKRAINNCPHSETPLPFFYCAS